MLGLMFLFYQNILTGFFKQVMGWVKSYKGVFRLWLGPNPIIFAAKPEVAEVS